MLGLKLIGYFVFFSGRLVLIVRRKFILYDTIFLNFCIEVKVRSRNMF